MVLRFALCGWLGLIATMATAADPWLVFPGGSGPGAGKHIVLVSGDEEYRSEECLPMLGKILSATHGFKTTVLFAIDPADGTVAPNIRNNIPGLETLATADLLILFTRYRDLPDEQMKHFDAYFRSGKPIIGLRTATHAFNLSSPTYQKYSVGSKDKSYQGGFGKRILGETWVAHHGAHGKEGTRGIVAPGANEHPILKGISPGSVYGTSDVYTVNRPLAAGSQILLEGEVTKSLAFDAAPVEGTKNAPRMPLAWVKPYAVDGGKPGQVFTTTLGSAQDFQFEGSRRLVVNAAYFLLGLAEQLPETTDVRILTEYRPSPFKFKKDAEWKPGKPPSEYALPLSGS